MSRSAKRSTRILVVLLMMGIVLMPLVLMAEEIEQSKRIREARVVLEKYFKCEENEDYELCYDLISSAFKKDLQKDGITNRAEYKIARKFAGRRWLKPEIKGVTLDTQQNVLFTIEATFEQPLYGERVIIERKKIVVILIQEGGKWVIFSWG